jgi:sec-independent protein translocase protein TatA
VVFGPGKLPEMGKSLGEAIRGFKKAVDEPDETKKQEPSSKQDPTSKPN